jgi:hypothetical protein
MAKKASTTGSTSKKTTKAPARATKTTEVRNTPIPKIAKAAAPVAAAVSPLTREMIAKRAYEIWTSGKGGSEEHNWLQAERELRAGI